jgi:hypothetical protein
MKETGLVWFFVAMLAVGSCSQQERRRKAAEEAVTAQKLTIDVLRRQLTDALTEESP